jgi:predicted enzyme related to lactoylglutathione lyase
MGSMSESVRGRFLWYELLTSAPEAARAFYPPVTGWKADVWHPTRGEPYHLWISGDYPIGGMLQMPEEALARGGRPSWLAHVGIDDVEAGIRMVESLGGRRLAGPMEVETVGRFCVLMDPQGGRFSIYRPAAEPPEPGDPDLPGSFAWEELSTPDPDAAFAFYARLFGWEDTGTLDLGEVGPYRTFGLGGRARGGIFAGPGSEAGPARWLTYVRVADLDAALDEARRRDGSVLTGPMEVPGGERVAILRDPQGADLGLVESAAPNPES